MRIMWLCFFVILMPFAALFLMRALSYFELAEKGLKKHRKAINNDVKAEIWERMCEAKVDGCCWIGFTILTFFAMLDCILNVIQGVDFL